MKPHRQSRLRDVRTVAYDARRNAVLLLDQRLLPHRVAFVTARDFRATARAIRDMVVRGAPAIAAAAAYGFAQGARAFRGRSPAAFHRHAEQVFHALASARPTAVDPLNALRLVRDAVLPAADAAEAQALALAAAELFAVESAAECAAIGRHGLPLIRDGARVLTHCNAGRLACVDHGTATAPLYAAHAAGRRIHVWCDETRPRGQGASLTAWELAQAGIAHAVIADSAAGHLMQRGEVDLVIVGADRVLGRTGDIANKIGTYTVAVLAARHRIPFYVAAPFSTLDWATAAAADIPDRGTRAGRGDRCLGLHPGGPPDAGPDRQSGQPGAQPGL